MDLDNLTKSQLREILRTCRGFPAQKLKSKRKSAGHAPMAHATTAHLHGTRPEPYKKGQTFDDFKKAVTYKSKFYMLEDMVNALWLMLQKSAGKSALRSLSAGSRKKVTAKVGALFDVEVYVEKIGRVKFTKGDQSKAGRSHTKCLAILEGRDRNGVLYLHVQTFYPILDDGFINELLNLKTA
ncbi:MAG TPA: hypothetical protein VGY55_20740 [Pirellulales bacterium]|jgi:hypothetical protein|nr:hypothetical protein [Pirellulales bacterium]